MEDTLEDRISKLIGRTMGKVSGFAVDPKAARLPEENIPSYMGRRLKESVIDSYAPIQELASTSGSAIGDFITSLTDNKSNVDNTSLPNIMLPTSAEEATRRRVMLPSTQPARPISITIPEGVASIQKNTGINATSSLGDTERSQMPFPSENTIARVSPENPYGTDIVNSGARTGQIRVGAATDAEADRNIQSRLQQDQAARNAAASFDRSTEALRSLRQAQSPAFSFGVDSIGGGPDTLDVASGRVITRDTPANVVSDQMANAARRVRMLGGDRKVANEAAQQVGRSYLADKTVQQGEIESAARTMNTGEKPFDRERYLLDREKFMRQQEVDKARLNIDTENLRTAQAGNKLKEREYADKRKKDFLSTFTYPDENAPVDQIGATILMMSDATRGAVPPETMTAYFQQAAKAEGVDWKNAPPKDLNKLAEKAMALATQANRN